MLYYIRYEAAPQNHSRPGSGRRPVRTVPDRDALSGERGASGLQEATPGARREADHRGTHSAETHERAEWSVGPDGGCGAVGGLRLSTTTRNDEMCQSRSSSCGLDAACAGFE